MDELAIHLERPNQGAPRTKGAQNSGEAARFWQATYLHAPYLTKLELWSIESQYKFPDDQSIDI